MRALGAFGVGYGRRPARVDAVAPGSFGERGTLPRQGRAGQVCIDTGGPLGNESLFAHGEINFGKRGDGIGGCIARSGGLLLGLRLLGGGDTSLLLGTSGLLRGDASSFFLGFDSFDALRDVARCGTGKHGGLAGGTLGYVGEVGRIGNGDIRVRTADAERIDIVHGAASSRGEPEADAPGQHARCAADRDNFSSQVRLLLYIALFSQNVSYLSLNSTRPSRRSG